MHTLREDTPQLEVSPVAACRAVVTSSREGSGAGKISGHPLRGLRPAVLQQETKRADLVSFQELYLGSFKELDAIQS